MGRVTRLVRLMDPSGWTAVVLDRKRRFRSFLSGSAVFVAGRAKLRRGAFSSDEVVLGMTTSPNQKSYISFM